MLVKQFLSSNQRKLRRMRKMGEYFVLTCHCYRISWFSWLSDFSTYQEAFRNMGGFCGKRIAFLSRRQILFSAIWFRGWKKLRKIQTEKKQEQELYSENRDLLVVSQLFQKTQLIKIGTPFEDRPALNRGANTKNKSFLVLWIKFCLFWCYNFFPKFVFCEKFSAIRKSHFLSKFSQFCQKKRIRIFLEFGIFGFSPVSSRASFDGRFYQSWPKVSWRRFNHH